MLPNIAEVLQHSVTKDDPTVTGFRHGSPASGVWNIIVPSSGEAYYGTFALPIEPPMYWSKQRDALLRATVLKGGLWADAVGIACTKTASQSFEVEADNAPQLVKRAQELMIGLDGTGYVHGVQKGVRDFLTTDNGEFWEIVRSSNAAGSRILALMHLDSLRCFRTGDEEIPIIYVDLKGVAHELKQHEVITMCDMPSSSADLRGVGLCAASRAYGAIFKENAITMFLNEKLTGGKASEIHLVNNVSEQTIKTGIASAEAEQIQEGYTVYKNVVVIPVYTENTVTGYKIDIRGVPNGFDRKVEKDISALEFVDAIGMDLQDLQPLSGQGLGTGAQSHVQAEKAKGKGLSARRKQFGHNVNEKVLPDRVTFYFKEVDLTDDEKQANISKTRAETRQAQIQSGEITSVEARALAVDKDDLPQEFKPELLNELDDTLSDEEKPETEEEVDQNTEVVTQENQQAAQQPTQPVKQTVSKEHVQAIYQLAKAISKAKV